MNDMAIIYVDVVGEILAADLTPAVGTVTFQIPLELRDVVANIVYAPTAFEATLDVLGQFTITGLPSTDSPDVDPLNWLYRVHVNTDIWAESFSTSLPGAMAPVADFADLIPTESEPCTDDGSPCASVAQIAALQNEIARLEAVQATKVTGPAVATDNAVARFDLATGKLIQNSTTTIADTGEMVNRGDMIVRKIAATGEYGLRVSGGGLDFDAAGFDLFISVWSGVGVGIGTQRTYIRAESGAQLLHALGRWIWAATPFGAAVHALDPVTGVAELGGKNGLLPWQICGRGVVPGAPVAGAWLAGDIMMDSVGEVWLCVTAGSPGVWVTGP